MHIRRECCKLGSPTGPGASKQVLLLLDGNDVLDLADFVRTQHEVQDNMRNVITSLSQVVLATVRVACDEVVDEFLKLNNIVANHKMTFMERASLRSECRHLTRFLRLVDMMLQDTLKTLVLETVLRLARAVEQPQGEPFVEFADEVDIKAMAANRKTAKRRTPLVRVVVEFKKSNGSEFFNNLMALL